MLFSMVLQLDKTRCRILINITVFLEIWPEKHEKSQKCWFWAKTAPKMAFFGDFHRIEARIAKI